MTATRIYLIGTGFIGAAHATAARKLSAPARLLAYNRSPAPREAFARQFPDAEIFDDPAAMLAQPASPGDIVIVATSPASHLEFTRMAFESGRHVLCEKPLGLTAAEAREMLDLARRADRTLGCCSNRFLATPAGDEARRIVQSGELGKLYHATFIIRRPRSRAGIDDPPLRAWFTDPTQGGGMLMDMGPYDFTTLADVLAPRRVDVLSAWTACPIAAPHADAEVPEGAVTASDQHAGASLLYHLTDGTAVAVTYERAGCTHGAERSVVEFEGLLGAVSWDWPDWMQYSQIRHTCDRDGRIVEQRRRPAAAEDLHFDDKPLVHFHRHLQGGPSAAVTDERAVFNFCCLTAVLECARTGRVQSVRLEDFSK